MAEEPMLPPGSLDSDFEDIDADWIAEYSSFMRKAGEPSLWKTMEGNAYCAYRLLLRLELLSTGPLLIRLEILPDGKGVATIKIWESGEEIEKILINNEVKRIDKDRVDQFLRQIENVNFWNMPALLPQLGADGESWYLEGTKD